jgi:hypothetical protein
MHGTVMLCEKCADLDPIWIIETGQLPPRSIFTVSGTTSCPFCELCIKVFAPTTVVAGGNPSTPRLEVQIEVKPFWNYSHRGIESTCHINWLKLSAKKPNAPGRLAETEPNSVYLQLLRSPTHNISDEACYLWGRRVEDSVDLNLVRFWISQCNGIEKHEGCEPTESWSDPPEYLIDTSSRMLVPNPGPCQFAALSYVWGGPDVPQLKLEKLQELEPGRDTWNLGTYWEQVPNTIRDAILLCELLSIPYLWVDALCIVHTRLSDANSCDTKLARKMANIYSAARLTIVAAAGKDSWTGLPGLRNGSRKIQQHVANLGNGTVATVLPGPGPAIESSVWNTRAWTFQESILSNRLLVFTDTHCFWSCNLLESTFCEDIHREIQPDLLSLSTSCSDHFDVRDEKSELLCCPYLNRHEHYQIYVNLMEDFTTRRLTYQQDVLDAFGGIAHFLEERLSTTFLWGIPQRFFEQALLFDVDFKKAMVRGRRFPSWSWTGWYSRQGAKQAITCDSWRGERDCKWHLDDFRSITTLYSFRSSFGEEQTLFHVIPGNENPQENPNAPSYRICPIKLDAHPSHFLLFDAEAAYLTIRRRPEQHECKTSVLFSVHILGHQESVGSLELDASIDKKHYTCEFVAIAQETRQVEPKWPLALRTKECREYIHTLLVHTNKARISERVQIFTLDKVDWDKAGPTKRTFLLK